MKVTCKDPFLLAACCFLFNYGCGTVGNTETADHIFINGGIYTVSSDSLWVEAVAVKGNRIVAVGSNVEIKKLRGKTTKVTDLTGKMLMPGFIDAHIHPMFGALFAQGVELQFDNKVDILRAVKRYAQTHPEITILRGFGWRYEAFPETGPVKEDLDAVVIDKPVILIAVDAHTAWLNSKALIMAGITEKTPDPIPGYSYFARDERTGELTGWIVELPAILKVLNSIDTVDQEMLKKSLSSWASRFAEAGITTVFEAGILGLNNQRDGYAVYDQMATEGILPFRVVGAYAVTAEDRDAVMKLMELKAAFNTDMLRVSHLKLFVDGTDATHTAAMLEPYSDKPDTKGRLSFSESYVYEIVREADMHHIDIMFHALGDRAARIALDAIDSAITKNQPRERRNTIAHLQACDPSDWVRFSKQNSIAQFSIQWAVPDPYLAVTLSRWGPKRSAHLYPARAIHLSRGKVTFGSDWPAAAYYITYKPLEALQVALTRKQIGHPDEKPLMPYSERFTLKEALPCYTINGAYQLNMEKKIGSIEKGKFADLVVLSKNLFHTPDSAIHNVKVELTMMDGKITYRKQ